MLMHPSLSCVACRMVQNLSHCKGGSCSCMQLGCHISVASNVVPTNTDELCTQDPAAVGPFNGGTVSAFRCQGIKEFQQCQPCCVQAADLQLFCHGRQSWFQSEISRTIAIDCTPQSNRIRLTCLAELSKISGACMLPHLGPAACLCFTVPRPKKWFVVRKISLAALGIHS